MFRYADQESLMTVVLGSIQSRRAAISLSAFLSETGTRNVLPDSTMEHSLPSHFLSSIVLMAAELSLVDFDGLVRSDDFLRAAQHIVQHDLSA
jgi:hypothetical protein